MIGIIGAMQMEIDQLLKIMTKTKYESFSHMKFFIGNINNIDCVVATCGPGKVNAAVCAQLMILKYNPKIIINIGVAGSLEKSIKIGDIILADFVVQHDVDTSAIGDERGFISGIDLIMLPCSKYVNKKIEATAAEFNECVTVGTIATGDQFISDYKKILDIKNTFNANACEMEAGSIGQVCLLNKVEFAVIKVISDNANEESNIDYEEYKTFVARKISKLLENSICTF